MQPTDWPRFLLHLPRHPPMHLLCCMAFFTDTLLRLEARLDGRGVGEERGEKEEKGEKKRKKKTKHVLFACHVWPRLICTVHSLVMQTKGIARDVYISFSLLLSVVSMVCCFLLFCSCWNWTYDQKQCLGSWKGRMRKEEETKKKKEIWKKTEEKGRKRKEKERRK